MSLKLKNDGFTLLEMLLVMVIVTVVIAMGLNYTLRQTDEMRNDKASLQYQQILNAALVYYVNTSTWPSNSLSELTSGGYLPAITLNNPWGYAYGGSTVGNLFYVHSRIPSGTATLLARANALAGRLPMAYVSTANNPPNTSSLCAAASATCYLAAAVTVPGQNLNNARSVNFANIYHAGACVPAPVCPAGMTQQIMVVPVSVSGLNEAGSNVTYPIQSFTAHAYGGYNGTWNPSSNPDVYNNLPRCNDPTIKLDCTINSASAAGLYWRVCLKIITAGGDVYVGNPNYGQSVSVLAITRCAPTTEPVGSDFTVYGQ